MRAAIVVAVVFALAGAGHAAVVMWPPQQSTRVIWRGDSKAIDTPCKGTPPVCGYDPKETLGV